jgi:hypothetical protein
MQTGIARASDAGDVIDPVEAAKQNVTRSKDLAASAADDLKKHRRWMQDALAAEAKNLKKHARWLKRQEAMQQRSLKRRRLLRSCTRSALALVRVARPIARSLWKGGLWALVYLRDLLLIGCTWIALCIRTAALSLLGLLAISASWLGQKTQVLAIATLRAASISASWLDQKTRVLAIVTLRAASISASWFGQKTRVLVLAIGQAARALVRKFLEQAQNGHLTRSALSSSLAPGPYESSGLEPEAEVRPASNLDHDKQVPRRDAGLQSTALVCIAPPRVGLPVVQQIDMGTCAAPKQLPVAGQPLKRKRKRKKKTCESDAMNVQSLL